MVPGYLELRERGSLPLRPGAGQGSAVIQAQAGDAGRGASRGPTSRASGRKSFQAPASSGLGDTNSVHSPRVVKGSWCPGVACQGEVTASLGEEGELGKS